MSDTRKEHRMAIKRTKFKASIPVTLDELRHIEEQDNFWSWRGKRDLILLAADHSNLVSLLYTHLTLALTLNVLHFSKSSLTWKCPRVSLLCKSQRAQLKVITKWEREKSRSWPFPLKCQDSSLGILNMRTLLCFCVRCTLDKHHAC